MSEKPYAAEGAVPQPRGGCTVRTGAAGTTDDEFQLPGGESVFARDQIASGAGGRFALAGAKCERRLPARYGPAPEVPNGCGRTRVFPWRGSGSGGFHPQHREGYR
jgi:hypothetical protein